MLLLQLFPVPQATSIRRGGVSSSGGRMRTEAGVISFGRPYRKLEPMTSSCLPLMERSWQFISYRRHVDVNKGESMDNHIITKFYTVVPYAYMSMYPNFGKKTITFAEVTHQSDEHSDFRQHKNIHVCLVIHVK